MSIIHYAGALRKPAPPYTLQLVSILGQSFKTYPQNPSVSIAIYSAGYVLTSGGIGSSSQNWYLPRPPDVPDPSLFEVAMLSWVVTDPAFDVVPSNFDTWLPMSSNHGYIWNMSSTGPTGPPKNAQGNCTLKIREIADPNNSAQCTVTINLNSENGQ